MEPITITGFLAWATDLLRPRAGEAARLESEILLAHVLDRPRTHLIAWPDQTLPGAIHRQAQEAIRRRERGEPIAYITGEREFWSLPLKVTRDTLIPRADTECLVARALELLLHIRSPRVADLGTGSGAIALAIARERPDSLVLASDRSTAALAVARENAQRLRLTNIRFHPGSWCQALPEDARFDLILSNPPYIADDDPHLQQGDLPFEPRSALAAGADGLDDIRQIAAQAKTHLQTGGGLLLEHGSTQGPGVRAILGQQGYNAVQTLPDWEKRDRMSEGFLS